MLKNKLDKKPPELSFSFENILVCKEKRSRPFIEVVIQDPENVEQQNLGTFIGIFEVSDDTEESSYIVNYIISVIKKEYFSKPRRGPVESFEMALHKANLALSKLAEHGSISWIGKLNIACAVFEKSRLHLAKSGTASILLFRSKTLTDIGENPPEEEEEPNPLKTFDNVSSGKLEVGDKLLIATDSIFEIFSFEEIKKSILRFSDEELAQFFKTALGNELTKAATLIVSVDEKIPEPQIIPRRKPAANINAFSHTAFMKAISRPEAKVSEDSKKEPAEVVETTKDNAGNRRKGHIYIKEADHPPVERGYFPDFLSSLEESAGRVRTPITGAARKIPLLLGITFSGIWRRVKEIILGLPKEKIKNFFVTIFRRLAESFRSTKSDDIYKTPAKRESAAEKTYPSLSGSFLARLLPSFRNIKTSLSRLNREQKMYAVLILLAIVFVPYFGIKISNKLSEKNNASVNQEAPLAFIPLAEDRNVVRIESVNSRYSENGVFAVVNLDGEIFGISDSEIINLENGKKFPYPEGFGPARLASEMNDLDLIFLINGNNKIISFGAISKQFQENILNLPENVNIVEIKTYLTYLYLLDNRNSQIYRYPRAIGGFGEKTDWLKDEIDLASASGMAINENIFSVDGKNLIKLFRGKRQDFNLEETSTPIVPYKIYASQISADLYVLDKLNSRIIKLDGQGKIVYQYYHPEIGSANGLAVNEERNEVYFSTSDSIRSFDVD